MVSALVVWLLVFHSCRGIVTPHSEGSSFLGSERNFIDPGEGPQINILDGGSANERVNVGPVSAEEAKVLAQALHTDGSDLKQAGEDNTILTEKMTNTGVSLAKGLADKEEQAAQKAEEQRFITERLEQEERSRHMNAMRGAEAQDEMDQANFHRQVRNLEKDIGDEERVIAHDSKDVETGLQIMNDVRRMNAGKLLVKKSGDEAKLHELADEGKIADAETMGMKKQERDTERAKNLALHESQIRAHDHDCDEKENAIVPPPVGIEEGIPCQVS